MKFEPEIFLKSVAVVYVSFLIFITTATSNDKSVTIIERFGTAAIAMFLGWPITLIGLFLVYCGIYVYKDKQKK